MGSFSLPPKGVLARVMQLATDTFRHQTKSSWLQILIHSSVSFLVFHLQTISFIVLPLSKEQWQSWEPSHPSLNLKLELCQATNSALQCSALWYACVHTCACMHVTMCACVLTILVPNSCLQVHLVACSKNLVKVKLGIPRYIFHQIEEGSGCFTSYYVLLCCVLFPKYP